MLETPKIVQHLVVTMVQSPEENQTPDLKALVIDYGSVRFLRFELHSPLTLIALLAFVMLVPNSRHPG